MISKENKNFLQNACRVVLRPLASMLLKCGMTWKEFSDISKSVFVDVASSEYGIDGRPTNVSRVSILTGISRKEVKRQRDLINSATLPVTRKTNDATRVLSGWHQDEEFVNENKVPLTLSESGPGSTFDELCSRYGGDISSSTMLKELLKTGAVRRLENGKLQVLQRYYQPAIHDDENFMFAVDRISDVIDTMNNNVFLEEDGVLRFGGFADNEAIPLASIPEFHKYMDKRGQAFLEEIDDWLTANAAKPSDSVKTARVGISLFTTQR